MATRLRLISARTGISARRAPASRSGGIIAPGRISAIGLVHLVLGILMTLVVIKISPHEGDPLVFRGPADKLANGLMAYRDVSSEYPPVALVHTTLPRLIGGASRDAYQNVFSAISLLLAFGTLVCVWWLARRRWSVEKPLDAAAMFVGLALAAAPVVVWRFDILPAFFTAAALVAFAAGRNGWTGMNLGLGSMAKLYPTFLVPVFAGVALAERRWRDIVVMGAAFAMTAAILLAGPVLVAGTKAFSYVLYQEQRGIEIESLMGGIAMLAHVVADVPAKIGLGFGSWQVTSPLIEATTLPANIFNAALYTTLILAAGYSFRRDAREHGAVQPQTIVSYTVATLLVIILTNKVLSPQYLVWLLPFAALMPGRHSLVLVATLMLTTALYPLTFQSMLTMKPNAVVALNVRNVLLLLLFVWAVVPRRAGGEPRSPALERSYVRDTAD